MSAMVIPCGKEKVTDRGTNDERKVPEKNWHNTSYSMLTNMNHVTVVNQIVALLVRRSKSRRYTLT